MQLNEEQQQVVNQLDKNILLLASAGTGKTNTLAYRVARILLSKKAQAKEILCLTFTNKAAGEMAARIKGVAGPDAREVTVTTFHSFCYSLLQAEGKRQDDLFTDMLIYDEEDCRDILRPFLPGPCKEAACQQFISLVKEYRALYNYHSGDSQRDYEQTIEHLQVEEKTQLNRIVASDKKDGATLRRLISVLEGANLLARYDQAMQDVHALDFTDLITQVHYLLQDPEVYARWQHKYKYISVDEMQDTSDLEYVVLKKLFADNHILLCGDYFQTIYEWRGSNPKALLSDYRAEFKPETIIFYENYRASQVLFNASFAWLRQMFPHIIGDFYKEKPYAVTNVEGAPIRIHQAPTNWKEGAYIFDAIQKLPRPEEESIGILVRNNRQAQQLSYLFASLNAHIPQEKQRDFMIIDEFKFFRRQEIKDILAYFKLLLNPNDAVSAKRICKRFVLGVGQQRLEAIEAPEARQVGLKLTDFFSYRIFQGEPYETLVQALAAGNVVVYDVESTGTDTLTDEIVQIAAIRLKADGSEGERFVRFIKPSKSVGESEAVHHFSDAYLAEHGETAELVLQEFKEFSRDAVIVGHNVMYDVTIFTNELARHNLGKPAFAAIYDTLDMYRRFYPNLQNHKLGFLSDHFAVDHKPTHNALDDILATARILLYVIKENIVPTADKRKALIANYKDAFSTIATQMETLRRKSQTEMPTQLLAYIMNDMGVLTYYKSHGEAKRVDYIRDLYRIAQKEEQTDDGLSGRQRVQQLLRVAALHAGEPDPRLSKKGQRIPIITVHQAKGSEFDHVFLAGMNRGVFPSPMAVRDGKEEEERRLFYVAMTRAKKDLTVTYVTEGRNNREQERSPYLSYIPKEYVQET